MPEVDETRAPLFAGGRTVVGHWDFYMALGYFKLAIIAAGIAFRARMGGGVAADTDEAVDQAVAAADRTSGVTVAAEQRGIAETAARLEAGLQIPLGGAAELDDARRAQPRPSAGRRTPRPSRIATPSGRFHCQPKKRTVADSVFCMMNTSSTIRIRNPTISADHSAAARVNLTADSGGGEIFDRRWRSDPVVRLSSRRRGLAGCGDRWRRRREGSLVMAPSLPFRARDETTMASR